MTDRLFPGQVPTNDAVFPALRTSIWSRRCVAVIGAGVSAPDYPLWTDLIGELQERCGVRAEDALSSSPLDIAQAAADKNRSEYFRALDEIFARRSAPVTAGRYHLLARIPFVSYVSLNVDPLLVETLDLHKDIVISDYPNLQAQNHGKGEVFCIHGRLGPDRPAATTPIVLTRQDFENAYDPYGTALHSFILQTLVGHDVCFLGCNPSEPHMARIFEACKRQCQAQHGLTSGGRPNWFLLTDEGFPQLDAIANFGIYPVQYSKRDVQFSGLDAVLTYLAKKKPPFLRPPGGQRSPFDPEVEADRS